MSQIHERIAAVCKEAKALGKDGKNQQQHYQFRGIEAVMNHLHPLFARHEIFILPTVLNNQSEERTTKAGSALIYRLVTVRFDFCTTDGSQVSCVVTGESMDSGDKATNKALSAALKYALSQMLLLPYQEVDSEIDSPEVEPKAKGKPQSKPKARPDQLAKLKEFCISYQVTDEQKYKAADALGIELKGLTEEQADLLLAFLHEEYEKGAE
jgi:hypothetical protein